MKRLSLLLLFAVAPAFAQEIGVSDPTFEPALVASPRVASSGDAFITVWYAQDPPGVFASITDLNGRLRRGPITISLTGKFPAVGGGSNGSLVAWLDWTMAYTVFVDRVGNVGPKTLLADLGLPVGSFAIASNGSRFLVLVFTDLMTGYLFDQNGNRLSDPLPVGTYVGMTVISPDRDGFVVFTFKNGDQTIYARRVESTGAMQPWTTTVPAAGFHRIAAVDRFLLWEYKGVLHRVLTDAVGAPASDPVEIANDVAQLKKAVAVGPNALLLFEDDFGLNRSLMLIGADGRIISRTPLPDRAESDIASIGTRALLAAGGYVLLSGTLIDESSMIPVNLGRVATQQLFPQAASNGRLLLAAWIERTGQLFASRIDLQTGKHLDGRGILLDSHQYYAAPAVVALGGGFVVAYLEVSSGVAYLRFRRVFSDGTLDSAPTLMSTTAQPIAPRLATDGENAFLVWTENTFSIRGTQIARDGTILFPAILRISDSDDPALQFVPDVGFNGEDFLVAWQTQCCGRATQFGTSAVHVTRSGTVVDPPMHLPMRNLPRIAANGRTFAVAGQTFPNVFLDIIDGAIVDFGAGIGLGDVEQFGGGFLVVGTQETGFQRPVTIWAAQIVNDQILARFEPLPEPTSAASPSLTRTPTGVALTYTRAAAEEGFGGSMRAFVLPINEQRRRPASPVQPVR